MKRTARRLIAALLSFTLFLGVTPLSSAAAAQGDITDDGKVDTMDALRLYAFVSGQGSILTPTQFLAADMDGNVTVNMIDALLLYSVASGGESEPEKPDEPVEPDEPEKPQGVTVRAGITPESTYTKNIKVVNTCTGKTFTATTKSALQMAVAEIVRYEMGMTTFAEKSTEAWKAQAVAAYTMLARHCYNGAAYEIYMTKDIDLNNSHDKRIYDAVGEVLGIKIAYNDSKKSAYNQLCEVFYSAGSAGTTCSTMAVWGYVDYEYLQPVESAYDNAEWVTYCSAGTDPFVRRFSLTMDELKTCLKKWLGKDAIYQDSKAGAYSLYPTKTVGPYWMYSNLWYYNSKGQKTYVMGNDISTAICVYHPVIYCASHALTVVGESNGTLTIETRGDGHGIGLSQYGAAGYANEAGWTYDRILAHYFCIEEDTAWGLVGPKWD